MWNQSIYSLRLYPRGWYFLGGPWFSSGFSQFTNQTKSWLYHRLVGCILFSISSMRLAAHKMLEYLRAPCTTILRWLIKVGGGLKWRSPRAAPGDTGHRSTKAPIPLPDPPNNHKLRHSLGDGVRGGLGCGLALQKAGPNPPGRHNPFNKLFTAAGQRVWFEWHLEIKMD